LNQDLNKEEKQYLPEVNLPNIIQNNSLISWKTSTITDAIPDEENHISEEGVSYVKARNISIGNPIFSSFIGMVILIYVTFGHDLILTSVHLYAYEINSLTDFVPSIYGLYTLFVLFSKTLTKCDKIKTIFRLIGCVGLNYLAVSFADKNNNNSWLTIADANVVIPSLFMLYQYHKYLNKIFALDPLGKSKSPVVKNYILAAAIYSNLCLVALYHFVFQELPELQSSSPTSIIITRMSYSLFLFAVLFNHLFNRKSQQSHEKLLFFILAVIPSLSLIMMTNSLAAITLLLCIVNQILKVSKKLELRENISTYTTVMMIAYQFYFVTGHSNQIESIQMAAGFVGFEEVNMVVSGFLIVLNTFSVYMLTLLVLNYKTSKFEKDDHVDEASRNHSIMQKFIFTMAFSIITLIWVMIYAILNLEETFLVYDVIPFYIIIILGPCLLLRRNV
jgi:hypothetical protein